MKRDDGGLTGFATVAAALVIAAALLIGTILVMAGVFVSESREAIEEMIPHPLYAFSESWSVSEPTTAIVNEGFSVNDEMKEVRIAVETEQELGCAQVQFVSPSGQTHDATGPGCQSEQFFSTFTETGDWRVQYRFVAYAGSIDVIVLGFENAE